MNNSSIDPLASLSVRISTARGSLGSGFIVFSDKTDVVYVLTARHCIEEIPITELILVDFYDYDRSDFFPSIALTDRFYFKGGDSYDIAILPLLKGDIPLTLMPCGLLAAIPKNKQYTFRGFPSGHNCRKPEDMNAKSSFSSGNTTQLKSSIRPEDNETTAYANTQGFSGSGLVSEVQGQLFLFGIITHYESRFNTFTAHDLYRINELLSQNGRSLLRIENPGVAVKTEAIEPSFISQNKDSLRQAEAFWKDLQPHRAQTLIESVRQNVEESGLPVEHRNPILAKVYYLKAFIDSDLGNSDNTGTLLIQAYNLHQEKKEYRERAAAAYFEMDNLPKAYEIAESILEEDEENARAWTIMSQLKPELTIPDRVKISPVFKVGQVNRLAKIGKEISSSQLATIFFEELDSRPPIIDLNRLNIYYWDYVAQTAMRQSLRQSGDKLSLLKPDNLTENILLKYARDLLSDICERVHGSDFQDQVIFRIARFDYVLCQYFLTDDPTQESRLVQQLYQLFVGEKLSQNPSFLKGSIPIVESMPKRLIEVLVIFLQKANPQLVIDAVTEAPKSELAEIQLMLGQAHAMLKQTDKMIEAYHQYVIEVYEIDQHTATNCIVIIRDMVVTNQSLDIFLSWINAGKKFTKNFIKNLLIAFCQSADNTKRVSTKRLADAVKDFWNELGHPLRKALAVTYSDIEDWTTAKSLWRELIGDGTKETDELRIYIITLYREYQDFYELSTRLVYWRKRFTPDVRLILYESAIYRVMNNYAMQAEVAAYGMKHFPDNSLFWADRIRALHRLDDTDSLSPLLDERILTTKLPPNICMSVAHVYLVRNKAGLGKEACYHILKQNWANPIIKQAYLSLPTTYNTAFDTPSPEITYEGTVVSLSAEGREYLLELTSDELQYNPIAKQVVGLRLNESFSHKKPFTNEQITYSVVNIFDKYLGQCALIYEEIRQKPSAMPFQAFEFPASEDPTQLLDQMKKIIGPHEIGRSLQSEEAKTLFANHEIGFFELAQNVFGGDPIRAWEYATSNFGNGFPIFPLILLSKRKPSILVNEKTEFLLDFSSLLTMHYLARKGLMDIRLVAMKL